MGGCAKVGTEVAGGGFFSRMFSSKRIGPDGIFFKDQGEWGKYEGEIDSDQMRQGKGKMSYEDGCTYEGSFVDDKYHGDSGVYSWSDGDVYWGAFKDGKQDGIGTFVTEGKTEYAYYEDGAEVGEGLSWDPDLKSVFKTEGGTRTVRLTLDEAEKIAREKFRMAPPGKENSAKLY